MRGKTGEEIIFQRDFRKAFEAVGNAVIFAADGERAGNGG